MPNIEVQTPGQNVATTITMSEQIRDAQDKLNELLLEAAYQHQLTTTYARNIYDPVAKLWYDRIVAHLANEEEI